MGILDRFKKKQPQQPTQDQLTLEEILEQASSDPTYRIEFYNRLLTDELVILTQNPNFQEGRHTLEQEATVNIVSYADGKIPVFTSTDRIFDKGVIAEEVEYMQLTGKSLFDLAQGATFVLNPYSDYGKELIPEEIERLLQGTITATGKTITVEKETQVQLGQPAKYPTEIVKALSELFVARPLVKAAYLGWIYDPESGELPHYIMGIDADGAVQELTQEAGFLAQQFLKEHEFIDFVQIDDSPLSNYFTEQTTPFYQRKE